MLLSHLNIECRCGLVVGTGGPHALHGMQVGTVPECASTLAHQPEASLACQSEAIFPDPSDFERCCKLKDRLPSIVVEPTDGDVESGELRWPPEEFLIGEEEDEPEDEKMCEEVPSKEEAEGQS
ncbi:LBH protein, partial [Polypterus senegalus]